MSSAPAASLHGNGVLLRLLDGTEPAASRVHAVLEGAVEPVMSWINLGEGFSIVRRLHGHGEAELVVRDLRPPLDLDLPDAERVLGGPHLLTVDRIKGLSSGRSGGSA